MCILLVKDYLMGKKTKPYSLMMSGAKLFEIQRGVFFYKNVIEDISSRIRCNGWTSLHVCSQH
jgi:hypothetical protein